MRVLPSALIAAFALVPGASLRMTAKSGSKVTPVGKVLELVQGMLSRAQSEKHDEEIAFSAYKQWCEDTTREKSNQVSEANALIEKLSADITKSNADAARLAQEIAGHDADIVGWTSDLRDATEIRQHENVDFQATHKDYSESVDAIERALVELKKQNFNRQQATSLLQALVKKTVIPQSAKSAIVAFLAQAPSGLAYSAPEAHAYEFQSSGVIDMLQKLLEKFEEERTVLEKEETNAAHSFSLLAQDLNNQIASATAERNRKQEEKSAKEQSAANAQSDLGETTESRNADSVYLSEITNQCHNKAAEFESRQSLRAGEIVALTQTVELLQNTIAPQASKHLPTLVQKVAVSLIQVSASSSKKAVQDKVANYLIEQARLLKSTVLSQLASRVSEDHFAKVKQMIQDLVVRLMAEANEEAQHKGWCDTELKANDITRKEKTALINSLTAEIDELTAQISKLSQEITDLNNAVNALDASVAKATENRNNEKTVNTATIADAQQAQEAVAQALTILREFYAKASAATALAQTAHKDGPITWDKPYTGQGENKSVVDFLEVVQSDFARLETETKADEDAAAKAFAEFEQESALNKVTMSKDIEFKTEKKQTLSGRKAEKDHDREGAQRELDAALAYFEKLKPACIESGDTYEDRVGRRQQEIQSLQEALKILSGDDVALVQKASLRAIKPHVHA